MIALIPARLGSKRVPRKNFRALGGQPLWWWSAKAALDSGLFARVVVSTDGFSYFPLSYFPRQCDGANILIHTRKPNHATDTAHDYEWVSDVMAEHPGYDLFAILRPTSPFRTASTIRRAYAQLIASGAHSIRAVQPVREHPGKMWRVLDGMRMEPYHQPVRWQGGAPVHSQPTQGLDPVYVQNASLEMAWCWVLDRTRSIAGTVICPLLTDPVEGSDINTEHDWAEAERLAGIHLHA